MMTMSNEMALEDLKTRYGTPGDPLFMAGIQTIKDHYKSALSIETIRDFLAKSRVYTLHYEFNTFKENIPFNISSQILPFSIHPPI